MLLGISIHAPGWGATHCDHPFKFVDTNFNPRTRVGCDLLEGLLVMILYHFNPRTRVGCDCGTNLNRNADFLISIHAPGWGATQSGYHPDGQRIFQSTHPGGVRHAFPCLAVGKTLFQSTHPGGVRRNLIRNTIRKINFNPRTRVGCDRKRS